MSRPPATRAFRDMEPKRLAQILDTSALLGPCRNLDMLGPTLFRALRASLPVDRLSLWLGSPEEGLPMSTWAAQRQPDGLLQPVDPVPGWVEHTRNLPMDLWSLEDAGRTPLAQALESNGMPSWMLLPLRTPERLVGGLALASREPGAFREAGPTFLVYLAKVVATHAVKILRLRQMDELNAQLTQERDQQRILLEITNELAGHRDPRDLFHAISASLRNHFDYDGLALLLVQGDTGDAEVRYLDFPAGQGRLQENLSFPLEGGPTHVAITRRKAKVFGRKELNAFPESVRKALVEDEGVHTLCSIPLVSRDRVMGSLNFMSLKAHAFPQAAVDLLSRAAAQVAVALDNVFAYQEIQALRDKLAEENLYLHEEMDKDTGLDIVVRSPSMQRVLRQVETVAPSDATVLLLGETGTGKELLARAIHSLSPRSKHSFVQINCAAIPTGLVESELFGHEKGAFTGALTQKVGRMELAHQGTLFLDEIGDLPLELQPKLLRALQERQFERLGSTRTLKVDLRLVAATNRDLAAMVESKDFRADLYYRLNVFPVRIPPLRERREDIPALVRYFTQRFAQRMRKPIESIPVKAMEKLTAWDWPGNIRELENFIERSVILSPGRELKVPLAELESSAPLPPSAVTLEDAERSHILAALHATKGKVGGTDGAAARLGMKRTTLQSRMTRLGIRPEDGRA